jgi:transposase
MVLELLGIEMAGLRFDDVLRQIEHVLRDLRLRDVLEVLGRLTHLIGVPQQRSQRIRNRKEALCFSPYLYRARNLVERFFNKIKQCRRVATRYDKLAANYLAFIQLASIRLWLRINESTT